MSTECHYMIDLETLGVTPHSVITSIAVVQFDILTGSISREFFGNIDIQTSLDLGFTINGDTLEWWFSQPNRLEMFRNKQPIKKILKDLEEFLIGYNTKKEEQTKKRTYVWGNGSSFDLGILASAFTRCDMNIPWLFYNERDVRTLVSLIPEVKKNMVNNGTPHNALDDCKFQIAYCCEIWKKLKSL